MQAPDTRPLWFGRYNREEHARLRADEVLDRLGRHAVVIFDASDPEALPWSVIEADDGLPFDVHYSTEEGY